MKGQSVKRDGYLAAIVAWASRCNQVEALIQTGSLARQDCSVDSWSDLDLELITLDVDALIDDTQWLHEIGRVITVLRLEDGQEWPTRLVIFSGGIKADFTLAGTRRIQNMIQAAQLNALYERGYRVLLDKSGVTAGLPVPGYSFPVVQLPSAQHFRARVEEFWFEAFHLPGYLARGELFVVKQRDWTMKELLLEMMEWHALARGSGAVDIWHGGTRLHQWAEPQTLQDLQTVFGHFEAGDAKRAFEETTRLYARLAHEVARLAGFDYPQAVESEILALVSGCQQNAV